MHAHIYTRPQYYYIFSFFSRRSDSYQFDIQCACSNMWPVNDGRAHTNARIIDYAMQCTIILYNVCKHNTRTVSSMCDINDSLTALCVSQQRFERDHKRIHIASLLYSRTDSRTHGRLYIRTGRAASICECFRYFHYYYCCCYNIGCLVINDRRRVLCAHV